MNRLLRRKRLKEGEDESEDGGHDSIAPLQDTPEMRVAAWAANKLKRGEEITIDELVAQADAEFGGTFGEGAYDLVHLYDLLEVAGNQFIANLPNARDPEIAFKMLHRNVVTMEGTINKLREKLESLLPTPKRDVEKIEAQQFSTPFHYAYLLQWVANFFQNDVVLEPSAGTGNLIWLPKIAGIEIHVNEIAARRLAILEAMGFENITSVDARQLANLLPTENPALQPTVVVMNPPFSSNTETGAKGEMVGANMVSEALKVLAPGGRLVAIVSGGSPAFDTSKGMAFDGSKQMRAWWKPTRRDYIVRANIKVSGNVYKKFGTTFDTRVLVIDKPFPGQTNPKVRVVGGSVESISELPKKLEAVRDARAEQPTTQKPDEGKDSPQQPPVESKGEGTPDGDIRDSPDRDGSDVPGSSEGRSGASRSESDGVGDDVDARTPVDDESESDVPDVDDDAGDSTPESTPPQDSDEIPDDSSVGPRGAGSTDIRGDEREPDSDGGGAADVPEPGGSPDIQPGQPTRIQPDELDAIVEAVYADITEKHVEGTPLVTPTSLAITSSPDVSEVQLDGVNMNELSEAQAVMAKRILRSWDFFKRRYH